MYSLHRISGELFSEYPQYRQPGGIGIVLVLISIASVAFFTAVSAFA